MGLQDTGAGGIIYIIVGRAGKTGRKQTSSWLVRLFLSSFPHRADARCFLSGIAGQVDAPITETNVCRRDKQIEEVETWQS